MCGIFAYLAHDRTTPPDPYLMHLAADWAARRGPYAHGWAIPGQPTHRALGPLNPADVPTTAGAVVGHARLPTYGALTDLAGVQPVEVDGHRLAHNGNATDVHADHQHAPTDSFALALVYAAYRIEAHPACAALTLTTARLESPWALAVDSPPAHEDVSLGPPTPLKES